MYTLVYDGTMAGLLTCIFTVYERKYTEAGIRKITSNLRDAFATEVTVETNKEQAARVWKGMRSKLSPGALREFYFCFLSEMHGIENTLLQYAQYVFATSRNIEDDFGNKHVLEVSQVARKVGREKHRMEAFVRFKLLKDGIYYSAVEPDFNVLPVILPHFKKRYADQHWLIYDLRRKYGIYYNKDTEKVDEITLEWADGAKAAKEGSDIFSADEPMYQLLWKDYFKGTNIKERKNMKLHIQHVPRRYWKYLIEKQI
jgi:probable DNA metabolism protein